MQRKLIKDSQLHLICRVMNQIIKTNYLKIWINENIQNQYILNYKLKIKNILL